MTPEESEAARVRRAAMFGEEHRVAMKELASSDLRGAVPVMAAVCNECGNLVVDKDAHFGHHLWVENLVRSR